MQERSTEGPSVGNDSTDSGSRVARAHHADYNAWMVALRSARGLRCAGAGALAAYLFAGVASADVLQVGPGKEYESLRDVASRLDPGDVVEVFGGATYDGDVVFDRDGTADQPIVVRGVRVNGRRPVVSGGTNTIEAAGDHYVFEGLVLTQGGYRCFFHHAHDITLRDSVIHDCPKHGLLGADDDSGSLLLETTEVYACGDGDRHHPIYMATDERAHPGSVFRMQHCYVHDGRGGNNVKSRAERNEIYFNWIEGALYHEIELIGPDGGDPRLRREDSDVVGNVFRKTNDAYTVRVGGDGTGETNGRYRFVHNTFLLAREHRPVFRIFDGIESIEMHANAIVSQGGKGVRIVLTEDAEWATGREAICGTNNWIPAGSTNVPAGWTGTLMGTDPGFENLGAFDLRPREGSPLRNAAATDARCPEAFTFPGPLTKVAFQPPQRSAAALLLMRESDHHMDIGAYEGGFPLRAVAKPFVAPSALRTPGGEGPTLGPARPGGAGGRCGCNVPGSVGGATIPWLLTTVAALVGIALRRKRGVRL